MENSTSIMEKTIWTAGTKVEEARSIRLALTIPLSRNQEDRCDLFSMAFRFGSGSKA